MSPEPRTRRFIKNNSSPLPLLSHCLLLIIPEGIVESAFVIDSSQENQTKVTPSRPSDTNNAPLKTNIRAPPAPLLLRGEEAHSFSAVRRSADFFLTSKTSKTVEHIGD